jgi:DNA-binding PadR family transcriptional regulator
MSNPQQTSDKCPICKKTAELNFTLGKDDDIYEVRCAVCGNYNVTRSAILTTLGAGEPNYILSAAVRNFFERGEIISIKTENISHLLDAVNVPADPFEAIDLLIKFIFHKTNSVTEHVPLNAATDYPILFTNNQNEFKYYLQKTRELNYIEPGPDHASYRLTLKGWQRLAELKKSERKSDQAFVAMWFDSSLDEVWDKGFKPALEQTGFKPIRIDLTEHNEKICDKIIAEIRKSALVVADFTGQRGGVYFESGFAMGLGIPVIWTCYEKDISKLHFDTRQYNHIVWIDSQDLKTKLVNRIEATFLQGIKR